MLTKTLWQLRKHCTKGAPPPAAFKTLTFNPDADAVPTNAAVNIEIYEKIAKIIAILE